MRKPISGTMNAMPAYHTYKTRVEFAPNRTRFTKTSLDVATASFLDVGEERRVSYAIHSDGNQILYAWLPSTHMSSALSDKSPFNGVNPVVGMTDNTSSFSQTIYGSVSATRLTRLDVGPGNLLALVNGSNIKIYQVTSSPIALSLVGTIAHPVGVFDGLSVSLLSQTDIWLGWIENGVHYCRQWNGTAWGSVMRFSANRSLKPWHATGFRVEKIGSIYYIVGQHTAGAPVCRLYKSGILSEPFDILGADSEYAFQWSMVTDLAVINNKLFATVSRAPENSFGELNGFFSNMIYSRDGMRWTDWCGIATGDFRGGVVTLGNEVVAGSNSVFHVSPGTDITGNASWTELTTVTGWNYAFGIDRSASGNTLVMGGTLPQPGDTLRRWFTVNDGTNEWEFLYSTESVDSVPEEESNKGRAGSISSRGFLKYGVDYQSNVDEVFASGESRLADLSERQLVAKLGMWSHDANTSTMTVNDDKGSTALATLPEPIDGAFAAIFYATAHAEGQGPAFFVDIDNPQNYYRFVQTATGYSLQKIIDGTTTTLTTVAFASNEDHAWLVRYDSGNLGVYVSTPSQAANTNNYLYKTFWTNVLVTTVEPPPEQSYVGWCGKNGSTVRGIFLRRSGTSQTLGDVAEAVGARAGMQVTVQNQIEEDSTWVSTSTPRWYEEKQLDGYDLRMEVDLTNGPLRFAFGGPRSDAYSNTINPEDWSYMVQVTTTGVSLWKGRWDGSAYNWEQLSGISHWYTVNMGDHFRVRIARSEDLRYSILSIYHNHKLIWTLPMPSHFDAGYLAIYGGGRYRNLTVPGLLYSTSVHIWQAGRPAMAEIRALIAPLFWSLWEQPDGSIRIVPTDYVDESAGSVDSDAHVVNHVPDDEWASVYRVQGAEVYGIYVDPILIGRGVRPVEYDTPHLYDEAACVTHAYRRGVHARKRTVQKGVGSFLDPRMDIFTEVTIDGSPYVIESYTARVNSSREPNARIQYQARSK